MAEEKKYFRCVVCGQIVEADENGNCPICGAGPECLEPCDKDGNPIEEQLKTDTRCIRFY